MKLICTTFKLYDILSYENIENGLIDLELKEKGISLKNARNLYNSIKSHRKLLIESFSKHISKEDRDKIKRGNVLWMDFGDNIDTEFSGKHPAIILDYNPNLDQVTVIPLDLDYEKKRKVRMKDSSWVCISHIENFPPYIRWVNVHRVFVLSIKRFSFNIVGFIKKELLRKIDIAILKYQYKPQID